MRYLFIFILAFTIVSTAQAAEPVPGNACAAAGATMASNNSGAGHFMVCQGGSWKSVYSYNAAGNLTTLGNLSCNTGEFLKFDGTKWACAVSSVLPVCSEGEGLVYAGGAWVCLPQTPDAFSFTDQTNVNVSALILSNAVTITGIAGSVAVSVSGGGSPKIRINGGSWVSSGTIANGQTLEVQLTSSASNSATLSAVVTVGGGSDQWDVTTKPACGGVTVNGYCWYAGTVGYGCDDVCSTHGGCNLNGVLWAGSSGTNADCKSVMDALSMLSGAVTTAAYGTAGYGCAKFSGLRWRYPEPTTCEMSLGTVGRACACNY